MIYERMFARIIGDGEAAHPGIGDPKAMNTMVEKITSVLMIGETQQFAIRKKFFMLCKIALNYYKIDPIRI